MPNFEWIKTCFNFLCNMWMKSLLYFRNGSEHRQLENKTHKEITEKSVQLERAAQDRGEGEDTVDFGLASDLTHSLEKVSEAIYKTFVLNWHSPPEEFQNQPLYKEISFAIQGVFFNIQRKVRPLEEYDIMISIATGLIAHFRNQREKKRTYRFKSRQEKIDFIRKHIKCLLDYWLLESMQKSKLVYIFLTEILSVNVVEQIIQDYSKFTFINEVIVGALGDQPATCQKEDSGKSDKIIYDSGCSGLHDSPKILESGNITSRKKKKKRFPKKISEWLKTTLGRKVKKDEPAYRSLRTLMESDALPGSDDDDHDDVADTVSYDDSEDGENLITSITEKSLQMWLENNWTAKVSEKPEEEEDKYKISVYDESAPGTVLWYTERGVDDFKVIYEDICQKYPDLIKFTKQELPGDSDRQFFHSINTTPDDFIKALLDLVKTHHKAEAVFFFSPFEYEDDEEDSSDQFNTDDDSTSSGENYDNEIQYRMYNPQKEEEKSNKAKKSSDNQDTSDVHANKNESKNDDESIGDSDEKESDSICYKADGIKLRRLRKKSQSAPRSAVEEIPRATIPTNQEFPSDDADMRTEVSNVQQQPSVMMNSTRLTPQNLSQKGLDVTDQNIGQTMKNQEQKLQDTFLDVLYELIDEVLAGGKTRISFLHKNGILKSKSEFILNSISNLYTKEQITWCLNTVAELLMSQIRPQQLPPDVLQSKALELLKNKVKGLLTIDIVKFLYEKWIMKNLKASHLALQDPLANEDTLYGLLENLTKIITTDDGDLS